MRKPALEQGRNRELSITPLLTHGLPHLKEHGVNKYCLARTNVGKMLGGKFFAAPFSFPPASMSIEQRKHTRFSLEIPAVIVTGDGERLDTVLEQISVGGCFAGWEENIFTGDDLRLEVWLQNGNRLPLACRTVYTFENTGIGLKFIDITQFEQSLVAGVIREKLRAEGLPMDTDPFTQPPAVASAARLSSLSADERMARDRMLEQIMAGD